MNNLSNRLNNLSESATLAMARMSRELKNKKLSSNEKEHIHLNFYDYEKKIVKNPNNCPVKTIKCPANFSRPEIVLDVNTYEQYLFMQSLYDYLYPKNPKFNILDILDWYDKCYRKQKN